MTYEQEQQIAIDAVQQAALLCEQIRLSRVVAIEKQDRSPVTLADFGAQAIICRAISSAFPDDPIVGEEDAALLRQNPDLLEQVTHSVRSFIPNATSDAITTWIDRGNGQVSHRYWTLDPIDGTKGFLRNDQYAIALALIEDGIVQLGVLGCPVLPVDATQPDGDKGVLFIAVRGQGTQMISLQGGSSHSVRVLTDARSENFRLTESVETRHGNIPLQRSIAQTVGITAPPLPIDSQVKYGIIARGQAALYMRLIWTHHPDYQENIWDHAAGAIVVEEAGGQVTDINGKPLDFSAGSQLVHNRGIVASNGSLHQAVLTALRERGEG